ncbi:MAG: hypothetical protein E6767_01070 [Dysgonomonas sp.]|nr:hypothetical protein [Dysgonomonas sp.]
MRLILLFLFTLLIGNCAAQFDSISQGEGAIPKPLVKKLKPVLNQWLNYYKADISDFYQRSPYSEVRIELYDKPFEEDTLSLHYKKYDKVYDGIYVPMLYDYSPNKKYYLNVRETSYVYEEGGKWYCDGGDDCQEIYLTNRKSQKKVMVLWLGSSEFAEAAIWADNKTYAIVGRISYGEKPSLFIWIGGVFYYSEKAAIGDKSYFRYDLERRGVITD